MEGTCTPVCRRRKRRPQTDGQRVRSCACPPVVRTFWCEPSVLSARPVVWREIVCLRHVGAGGASTRPLDYPVDNLGG